MPSAIGAPLVVKGFSWKARFWKVRSSATADLNNVVVFILSNGKCEKVDVGSTEYHLTDKITVSCRHEDNFG